MKHSINIVLLLVAVTMTFSQQIFDGFTPYSGGRRLVRVYGSENLHIVYDQSFSPSDNHVYYAFSPDGGFTWPINEHISDPSVWFCPFSNSSITMAFPITSIAPVACAIFPYRTLSPEVGLYYVWRDPLTNEWHNLIIPEPEGLIPAQVSMVSTGDYISVVYNGQLISPPGGYTKHARFRYDETDPGNVIFETLDSYYWAYSPCIAADGNSDIHVVWERNTHLPDDIFYRKRENGIWCPPLDEDPLRITISDNTRSLTPFVECYGDKFFVTWSEEEVAGIRDSREIYEMWGFLPYPPIFSEPANRSLSPYPSESPVCTWGQFYLWGEHRPFPPTDNFDICYWSPTWGYGYVQETDIRSYYPHAAMRAIPENFWDEMYGLWTEYPSSNVGQVWFRHLYFGWDKGRTGPLLYYEAEVGKPMPSYYCLERDGFINYSNHSVDYAQEQLEYELPFLMYNNNFIYKVLIL